MKTVVIDAGHGGKDSGAVSYDGTCIEKQMTLTLAKELERELSLVGSIDVILTRYEDEYLTLDERAELANQCMADLFVSVHLNDLSHGADGGVTGTEVYHYPGNEKGIELAERLSKAISSALGINNRGAKPKKYKVLRKTRMTAVLIEFGFVDEDHDELFDSGKRMESVKKASEEMKRFLSSGD